MDITDILLGLKPRDAVIRMVNEENGSEFPFEAFVIGTPQAGVGRRTTVHISTIPSSSDEQDNPYSGEFDFVYNRLNLFDQFNGILSNFRPPMPTSTQILLDELTRLTGVEFDVNDVVLEDIERRNAAPYRLKAKSESLRWVGYVDITVVDLTDIDVLVETLLPPTTGPRLGTLDETPQLTSQPINIPTVNLTPYTREISRVFLNVPAQNQPILQWLIKQGVPLPGSRIDQGLANWVVSPTPAPFNLYNAIVEDVVVNAGQVSEVNANLDAYMRVRLSSQHCTNFADPVMILPFMADNASNVGFSYKPRLTQVAVVSDTDATAYNLFYNALTVGQTITELNPTWQFLTTDGNPWTASEGAPGPTSLYNAVVQYNGQLRAQDIRPENLELDRVAVLTLSEDNIAYRGNISIFYQSPIVLPGTLPNGYLNTAYSASLAATVGVGPFTYALVDGAFADNQSIDPDTGIVSGDPQSTGTFRPTIEVTGPGGLQVRYSYVYSVSVAPISIVGKAPNPVIGVSYDYEYLIQGGVGPYTLAVYSGALGAGLSVDGTTHRIVGTATGPSGPKNFSLAATDSRGVSTVILDSFVILEP